MGLSVELKGSDKVVFFSDVHVGAEDFRQERFEEALKFCADEKCYLTLGGDIGRVGAFPHGQP